MALTLDEIRAQRRKAARRRYQNPEWRAKRLAYIRTPSYREASRRRVAKYRRTSKGSSTNKEYEKKRVWSVQRRIKNHIATRVRAALKRQGGSKCELTSELLGCTIEHAIKHLERLFKPGMSWANHGHGLGGWHIDHIRPCASFDLTDGDQRRACFHWSNLQPLWSGQNLEKSDKITSLVDAREYRRRRVLAGMP